MEENRDYHAYRYGDHLTPGSELKIEHSVVCENVDISTLITMGTDSLEAMRQGSIDGVINRGYFCRRCLSDCGGNAYEYQGEHGTEYFFGKM